MEMFFVGLIILVAAVYLAVKFFKRDSNNGCCGNCSDCSCMNENID